MEAMNRDQDIAPPICKKCNNVIAKRDYLCCLLCEQYYHLDCTDISFQLFKLMKSKTFKCQQCINSPNYTSHSTPVSYHHIDHVTKRRKQIEVQCNLHTSNSFELLSDNDGQDEEIELKPSTTCSYSSLPNLSAQHKNISCPVLQLNNEIVEDLKEKIRSLEKQLEITEYELENQLSENHVLGKKILEYENKISKLSHICRSPHKSSYSSTQAKTKSYKKKNRADLSRTPFERKDRDDIIHMPESNKYIDKDHNELLTIVPHVNSSLLDTSSPVKKRTNAIPTNLNKTNICVLSSNKYNKTLSTFENVLTGDYHVVHYLKPYCGIKELLDGIEIKVQNYTYRDFCIVFVGDENFMTSQDHFKLINHIKEALQKIQHTNVILCLPTYRLNKHIFNGRVESFSNILYRDSQVHDYAYLLDTNLNLQYNHGMYRAYSGIIKTSALRVIFKDLQGLIILIEKHHISFPYANPFCNDGTFFRQGLLDTALDAIR